MSGSQLGGWRRPPGRAPGLDGAIAPGAGRHAGLSETKLRIGTAERGTRPQVSAALNRLLTNFTR